MSEETTRQGSDVKPLLSVLRGSKPSRRPMWMMRQAGRYLPEYREVRSQAGSFLNLCAAPKLAAEVTLQPLRRFDLDAAIIFADILLIPKALGQHLEFQEGEGPVLNPVQSGADLSALDDQLNLGELDPVFEALDIVSSELSDNVSLIGFCGAPWTVATYMVAGRGTPDQRPAREAAYGGEEWFGKLIDLLVRSSVQYLVRQVHAGAEAVQIFDTWAGVLGDEQFDRWCIQPTRQIVDAFRQKCPGVPVIGFPRGSGTRYVRFAAETGVDAIGLDWSVSLPWARDALQPKTAVQGNLDPVLLACGGDALDRQVGAILGGLDADRHVFNLGHGILPDTPIENVELVISRVRGAEGR